MRQCEEYQNDVHCISDLCLTSHYLEFDPNCASEDPFSASKFRENFNGELPPPSKFSRSESTQTEICCRRGAIVSLLQPHKILAVAPDILSIAEFSSSQIRGRSINVLFGPRADVAPLNSAIKNTAHGQSSTIDTVLCTSAGADLHVTVTFSPYHRPTDRCLGGCRLQIDCIHFPDQESSEPVFILDDFGLLCESRPSAISTPDSLMLHSQVRWCPSDTKLPELQIQFAPDPSTPSTKQQLRRRFRREANLAAGLVNEAERRRQQDGWRAHEAMPRPPV
jgi:hypothetical protein